MNFVGGAGSIGTRNDGSSPLSAMPCLPGWVIRGSGARGHFGDSSDGDF